MPNYEYDEQNERDRLNSHSRFQLQLLTSSGWKAVGHATTYEDARLKAVRYQADKRTVRIKKLAR